MRYRFWLMLGLMLLVSFAVWTPNADAQGYRVLAGDSSTLTVEAYPLYADVWLDGVPIGTAHSLVARTISVPPGPHVVQVAAEGYLPAVVDVSSVIDWATRVSLHLVPARPSNR